MPFDLIPESLFAMPGIPPDCAHAPLRERQSDYEAHPAEFHSYIRALTAASDLAHRAQLNALVDQMPEDPDAVWIMFDDPGYDLRIEDVVRCCRARVAMLAKHSTQTTAA